MGRGPSYPYVNLREAVQIARKLYNFSKRNPAPMGAVVKEAWGYSPTSSSGDKVLAALKAFGLIEEVSSGDSKSIKISDSAYRILVDEEGSAERQAALRDAALSPRWYNFCWEHFGPEVPPSMRSSLLFEHKFVETTVDKFIQDYKETVKFAALADGPEQKGKEESIAIKPSSVEVGDAVQWESQGVLQFNDPKVVRELSDDRKWAFVEGSNTGIPVEELRMIPEKLAVQAAPVGPAPQPRKLVADGSNMRQDVFSLTEGIVSVQWPSSLSEESYQDLADWLKLLERKIGRSVKQGG
jgi:hypothetical protein